MKLKKLNCFIYIKINQENQEILKVSKNNGNSSKAFQLMCP